ncbi:MAG: aminotransferase class IV [Desulfohalobiaceae bacterium]|nr:aminotransferase class IV [Desulfohalobiaceae bacterium]
MNESRLLSFQDVVSHLHGLRCDHFQPYRAMYSSWFGGIVRDPALMLVPIDDHMVHRGDGIFEAFKAVEGKIYLLEQHIDRLQRSTDMVQIQWPVQRAELKERILETIRAAGIEDVLIRLYLSRGPGDFSPRPEKSVGSQLYIVVTDLGSKPVEKYTQGCEIRTSTIPIKTSIFANVKSCNYLPNVLMKKEAEDAGVDYTISLDENGYLGEGPTENLGIITPEKEFWVPRFDRTLRGTTLTRVMELAEGLVRQGKLQKIKETDIKPENAYQASEMLIFGTTFDVMPIVKYDDRTIGTGRAGPFSRLLLDILRDDMRNNPDVLTPVW